MINKIVNENDKKFALKECICRNCPSFSDCKESVAYCVSGESKCITEKMGCICGGCPVYTKLNLKGYYFCIKKK